VNIVYIGVVGVDEEGCCCASGMATGTIGGNTGSTFTRMATTTVMLALKKKKKLTPCLGS
jgi:hypothetical protein